MKIKPVNDRILVARVEEEQKSAGGIIISDTAKVKPQEGKVVEAGPGKVDDSGKRIPIQVKKGDRILFSKYAGNAGCEGFVVLNKVLEGKDDFVFNAETETFEYLLKTGVIDPTKVVRFAPQHAAGWQSCFPIQCAKSEARNSKSSPC